MMPRKHWEASTDAGELLRAMYMRLTDRGLKPERGRKLTLYKVALCRKVWTELPWVCRTLVECAEVTADGGPAAFPLPRPFRAYSAPILSVAEQNWANIHANPQPPYPAAELVRWETEFARLGFEKPTGADDHLRDLLAPRFYQFALLIDSLAQLAPYRDFPETFHSLPILRDIAGNPYRPIKLNPEWRTDTVMMLARQMYDSRDFGAMPILADALQDANCNNDEILNHCREQREHARGCWVVDLVLGKE